MNPLSQASALDPTKRAFSLLEEFRNFAFKGNVIDLAVGVIIGAAFGKIVNSLVTHIIMPVIAIVLPGQGDYKEWAVTINGSQIPYGQFLAEVVNFLIVAAALFIFIVKFLGWVMKIRKKEAVAPAAPPPLTVDQKLLTEIRDLLQQRAGAAAG
jgi:large conductance mechanosensitive channel